MREVQDGNTRREMVPMTMLLTKGLAKIAKPVPGWFNGILCVCQNAVNVVGVSIAEDGGPLISSRTSVRCTGCYEGTKDLRLEE